MELQKPASQPKLGEASSLETKRNQIPQQCRNEFENGVKTLRELRLMEEEIVALPAATIWRIGVAQLDAIVKAKGFLRALEGIDPAVTGKVTLPKMIALLQDGLEHWDDPSEEYAPDTAGTHEQTEKVLES